MASWAFVTVLTSDSYLPGALVTARSIKDVEKASTRQFDLVCVVTLDSVSVQSIKALRQMYDLVISAEVIRSGHSEHELNLLGRQDLSSTITKIHIWRLTQYEKVIYVDSDTLLLRPLSHLFELASPFSACADIGWPDCFNSGLMVIKPSNETFEKIFQHFLTHGSWDGGDQGLLNDYFAQSSGELSPAGSDGQSQGWNRLSFVYNVTPSTYYTYAPAYKRYGDKISMIHFIGSDKPWHLINRRRYRNAYAPNQNSESLNAVDYDSLVDHWLDVYETVVGPIEPLEWSSFQPEFNVPKYLSEWDSTQPSAYKPPSLDELKETFSRRRAVIGPQSFGMKAPNDEGGYMTLPFLDLSRLAREYILARDKATTALDSTRDSRSVPPESNHLQERRDHLHQVWDPSRSSPPPSGGYQMNEPITKHYEAVWDKPFSEQSRSFFQPPTTTHSIPHITHQDYSQFSRPPQPNAVQAVFPWEENARHHAGRVFPSGESRTSTSGSSHHQDHNHSEANANMVNQASLSQIYRNAWDDDPMIGRWAKARSVSGSNKSPSPGWAKSEKTKAALVQTPRLEIRGFDFDRRGTEGKKAGRETSDVGRIPTFDHSHQHQHHPSRQITFSSSLYRPRSDSEGSSQDADEEDVGEDEDQSSDVRALTEGTSSELTSTTPPEKSKASDQISGTLEATENPEVNKTGSFPSTFRLPTNRSMIIGVPVQMLKTSSSSSNSSAHSWEGDNNKNLARRTTSLMG
ncbi:uncharacterized protein PGTG_07830 [Puccinia graminis f. sp. tritici CRL 75-36-700-3]|uniref:Glycogenin glucosyltransferase n=1 Tax=Puccinia graminis f. sp. tritici (strain CRL 75-36-700-3 / race SCCL) TaxID=418459 RepID=E3KB68_PUCGT|nr:uncharacterized protein PGTG_07830 [Puccinia graminis f. sp. tritici CRL 75-36-700-3]EFP81581.2 hypothetical protein PGTG_07830 [Puccinia graminis f. sp. tritici CRL 75-36-700-3]